MDGPNTPNFAAWHLDTLAKYALEQYLDNIKLREEMEKLRLHILDLNKLLESK